MTFPNIPASFCVWSPFYIAAVLIITPFLAFAAGSPIEGTQGLDAQIKSSLLNWQKKSGFPGASFAYVLPDGTSSRVEVGYADIESSTILNGHKMLGASTGKVFTAVCALRLVQAGKLSLDEPILKWLSEEKWYLRVPNFKSITLRSLLSHTSGVPNHSQMPAFLKRFRTLKPDQYLTPIELIQFVLDHAPLGKVGH